MNGDDDKPPEGNEEQRTVFVPSSPPPVEPGTPPSAEPATPTQSPVETPPPGTVYSPGPLPPAEPAPPPPSDSRTISERSAGDGIYTAFTPQSPGKSIQVGDVLNHIFEVKRFIARGGMGEVFEGVNVNSDERVAIKVMLPALAADPNVISMFRKEARTLTRLQAESLVQYRVLAQEPQLGVLYIVTEYIDGSNLADVLATLNPTPADLVALLRRLARGLRAAHLLGAIHRDISPDNVLLEDGKLEKAKIIDFGIAKDLDPGSATIVGEGFAGKLNYVAPEQLGDFGRDVGPWTDIYSLALVIMAVALGRNVQMGGSLVDAVDKRRAGVDMSGMPDEIRPVLERMLRPNPADRLRSMDEVLADLDQLSAPIVEDQGGRGGSGGSKTPLLLVGGGVSLLALIAAGWFLFGRQPPAPGPAAPGGAGPVVAVNNSDPVEAARSVVDATLPSVSCTWLTIVDIAKSDNGPLIKLAGVAGNPAAAQSEISRALAQRKIQGANIDFEEVSPITQSGCAALDTYRQIRAPIATHLTVPQRKFEMRMQSSDPSQSGYPGENAANVVLAVNIADPKLDFAMVGLEPSGVIDADFLTGSGVFGHPEIKKLSQTNPRIATDLGGDKYKMQLDVNHAGWSGVLLLYGKGPFEKDVIAPPLGARGPDWTNKFVSEAAAKGWQADMVWFKTVDEVKE